MVLLLVDLFSYTIYYNFEWYVAQYLSISCLVFLNEIQHKIVTLINRETDWVWILLFGSHKAKCLSDEIYEHYYQTGNYSWCKEKVVTFFQSDNGCNLWKVCFKNLSICM